MNVFRLSVIEIRHAGNSLYVSQQESWSPCF